MNKRDFLPISLVIPVRNESSYLDELFNALNNLSPIPSEIVFVDTASSDGSLNKLNDWSSDSDLTVQVCSAPEAFPGAARNKGISSANQEWIAFIDVGIVPKPNWLGELWKCRKNNNVKAIYGVCCFKPQGFLEEILCALSYGVNKITPVLPASLFNRSLFTSVGEFDNSLRAGEDIIWKMALRKTGVRYVICENAIVEYKYFSKTMWQAIRKQYIYEKGAIAANIGSGMRLFVLYGYFFLYPALAVFGKPVLVLFVAYWLLRGGIDPYRRSKTWSPTISQVVLLPLVASMLDLSAVIARIVAKFDKFKIKLFN